MNAPHGSESSTRRWGRVMSYAAWILCAAVLTLLFSRLLDRQRNPNQDVQTYLRTGDLREVILKRNRSGHYVVNGTINGRLVEFLLDTGATHVAVPGHVGNVLGLKRGVAVPTYTANGVVETYTTVLDVVGIGEISATRVPATINPHMTGDEVLLGMSFLKRFELIQRGQLLTIRTTGR